MDVNLDDPGDDKEAEDDEEAELGGRGRGGTLSP